MAGEQSANAGDYSCGGGGDSCTSGGASRELAIALLPDPSEPHRNESRNSVAKSSFLLRARPIMNESKFSLIHPRLVLGPSDHVS